MKAIKHFLAIVVLLCSFSTSAFSQFSKLDSLENLLQNNTEKDTTRVNLLNEIAATVFKINIDSGYTYAIKAGRLSREIKFKKGEAESFKNIAFYNISKGSYSESLKYYEKALVIYDKNGYKKRVALCYNNIGIIYKIQGNYLKALEFHKKALKTREAINHVYGIVSSLNNIGVTYYEQGEYNKGIAYYFKALEINEKLGDKNTIAISLNNIGVIYRDQGNYPKALEFYQKVLSIGEENGYKLEIISAMLNIGHIYHMQKNYSVALKYYNKALTLCKENGFKNETARSMNNIGIVYEIQKKYEKALAFYKEALVINESIGEKKGITKNLINISSVYIQINEYEKAKDYSYKALNLGVEIKSKLTICSGKISLAKIYLKENQYQKAYNNSKEAYSIASETGDTESEQISSGLLAQSCEKLGLYKEAYETYIVFKTMTDSIYNENNIKEITNLENQYAFDKEKETIAAEQAQKDAVIVTERQQERKIRNLFIGGSLILLVLALVTLRNLIQKRKANKILAEQKEEIETKNEKLVELGEFKENMNGMMIHDLKSPLNSILGLSKDNKVKEAAMRMLNLVVNIIDNQKFEETQMKLNLNTIAVHDTINEATEQLFFLAEQKEVVLSNQTNNYNLKADKEILVRILTNLLSNAIKFSPSINRVLLNTKVENNLLEISITNFGKAIPEKFQSRIFDKFAQAEKKKSGYNYSSGIGLTFCKLAVEAHEGNIGVESNEEQTRFWFTLPLENDKIIDDNINVQEKGADFILEQEDFEKAKLLIEKLKSIEIYESTKFEQILKDIKPVSGNFEIFLDQLSEKYYQMDEALFQKQLDGLTKNIEKL